MVKDIPADVAYIGGVWAEGVLYGFHIVVFSTLCYLFTSKPYTRGRKRSSRVLVVYAAVMFILSTAHIALALQALFMGLVYERDTTPGGPTIFYRENVFPNRKAIYIVNTLLGDSLMVWRVFVVYGRNLWMCAPSAFLLLGTIICGFKTIAANAAASHSSVFDPSILSWVTATFALTIATQVVATVLIAYRIYVASRPFNTGSPVDASKGAVIGGEIDKSQRAKYLSMVFLVVESGAVYTGAAIVQLVTTQLNMNAGVIMELLLAQLSALVPMIIVVRVGLGVAYDGPMGHTNRRGNHRGFISNYDVDLSTFQATPGGVKSEDGDGFGTVSSATKLDTQRSRNTNLSSRQDEEKAESSSV